MSANAFSDSDALLRHGTSSVLVVDDDADLREALVDLIENGGYTATGVSNGQEALDYLVAVDTHPKLIMLDLIMPVMDGWELLESMRRDPALRVIPVLVISARYSELAGAARPALDIPRMRKPIDAEVLFAHIDRACNGASRGRPDR